MPPSLWLWCWSLTPVLMDERVMLVLTVSTACLVPAICGLVTGSQTVVTQVVCSDMDV